MPFNQRAAKAAYDIVMKMDDDSAEMFARIVVADMLESTIEKNLPVLQAHLNEVVSKRVTIAKRMTVEQLRDEPTAEVGEFAKALSVISKATPYDYGYRFRESDFNRDPQSGQFRAKVVYNQTKPIPKRSAEALGIKGVENPTYDALSSRKKAEYQDAYRQLSYFLQAVRSGGAENQDVLLTYRNARGDTYTEAHNGSAPSTERLLDSGDTLVGMTARPTTLTVGGAAFGLTSALGAPAGERQQVAGGMMNRFDSKYNSFASEWNAAGANDAVNNDQLYRRISSGSKFVQDVAPFGSKAAVAGRLGQFVGEHGSEAEQVFGPAARKTAYRYRGTEKKPDKHLVGLYGRAINNAKMSGVEEEPEELQTPRAGGPPRVEELGTRRSASRTKTSGKPAISLGMAQQAVARERAEYRAPTWAERAVGRRVLIDQMKFKLPNRDLYELQLASGNTPPSEGLMLNKNGQIVTQAIGYGDDHYVPFNLKHLKGLKGGEYIRTRSVGGLTSEDIYTGLISGARQVTVVSRSGTFTMEFNEDFRGGRRHNDKARRMTGRYEQILDAVQSEKVSRKQIPTPIRNQIATKVREENLGESPTVIRTLTEDKIKEYRESPDITPEDQELISRLWMAGMISDPSRDAKEYRAQVEAMVRNNKDYLFRLDGPGYDAASQALEEQFPYYIKVNNRVEDERELTSVERDKGYVEPGHNRPTAAAAGLFGAHTQQAYKDQGSKFSASRADYQGYRSKKIPGEPDAVSIEGKKNGEKPKTEAEKKMDSIAANISKKKLAKKIHSLVRTMPTKNMEPAAAKLMAMDESEFAEAIKDSKNMEDWNRLVLLLESRSAKLPPELRSAVHQYGRSGLTAEKFSKEKVRLWPTIPYEFESEGVAYRNGDTDSIKAARQLKRREINARTQSILKGGNLSSLTEKELKEDLEVRAEIADMVDEIPELADKNNPDARAAARKKFLGRYNTKALNLFLEDPERLERGMKDVHRMRALNTLDGRKDEEVREHTGRPDAPEIRDVEPEPPTAEQLSVDKVLLQAQLALVHVRAQRAGEITNDPNRYKALKELRLKIDAIQEMLDEDDIPADELQQWLTEINDMAAKEHLETE